MSKQRNSNIGHVVCLLDGCQCQAAVRKNVAGKFYYDCPEHGRITPNLPGGQGLLMDRASIWGAEGPPADCARWIAEQWSWGQTMRDPEARNPVNGENPVNKADPLRSPLTKIDVAAPVKGARVPPPPPEPEPEKAPAPAPVEEEETETEDEFR